MKKMIGWGILTVALTLLGLVVDLYVGISIFLMGLIGVVVFWGN